MSKLLSSLMRRRVIAGGLAAVGLAVASRFMGGNVIASADAKSVATNPRLGINLAGVADWNTEQPFVDFFKQSRDWVSQKKGAGWGNGPALDLDEQGWIKALGEGCTATRMITSVKKGEYPKGDYIVLYDGEGRLKAGGDARVASDKAGRLVLRVNPRGGSFWLDLLETNPDNYLRNIRVIAPGFEDKYQENPWSPDFLARWQGVACLRMMDFMSTNNSENQSWAARPKVDDASYFGRGVPVELMVDLANRLKTDVWFCMPHLADDDYVKQFAQYVKENLDSSVKAWVEYSNEVWNTMFKQAKFASKEGKRLKLSKNEWEAGTTFTAHRALAIFKLWHEVFGKEKNRVVRVMAGFAANPYTSKMLVEYQAFGQKADVLAIAPYFGMAVSPKDKNGLTDKVVATWSVDRMFKHIHEVLIPESKKLIEDHVKIANKVGLPLVCYEAGQHLVGIWGAENNKELTELFFKANEAPQMKQAYLEYLNMWKQAGGDLICLFSSMTKWDKWGSWGLLRNRQEAPATSAKFSAAIEWAKLQGQKMRL